MKYSILIPLCVVFMQSGQEEMARKLSSGVGIACINSAFSSPF